MPAKKEILLATHNKGKLEEYRYILSPMGYLVYSASDLNIDDEPEENGSTYQENSYIKAQYLAEKIHMPVISDDSGLEILSLNREPGVYSARYAERCGGYQKAFREINARLTGLDRKAEFHCCICYLSTPEAKPLYFEGTCPGRILERPHGENGFGYDPIFHADEPDIDFGVATKAIKNKYSHRAKALRKLAFFLVI